MKPDISEFSYGFALTNEIVERFPTIRSAGAPQFPSLYQEGQAGGGYDVEIPGAALFLQFKLSEVLTRRNAKEASLLGLPYFRMRLRPLRHSAQHNLLLELERSGAGVVLYAAPEFNAPNELSRAFSDQTVVERSAFFAPSAIGDLPDEGSHYVVFTDRDLIAFLRSEPVKIKRTDAREILELLSASVPGSTTTRNESFFEELITQMIDVYRRKGTKLSPADLDAFRRISSARASPAVAQFVSQTLFDCELMTVGVT